ncbi:hypothetical protein CCMSSC00406_0007421 [Pleurotus cornucopiae]|uniref:Uncharacterized protein n=1 Tax=Pleurotus cornucopiae TaxID=5321 RepID=A0ACB7J5M8_PLECO|nr:hypothetical protein CCMSSC00406_0007421 [Pleurotus cornucopiae]
MGPPTISCSRGHARGRGYGVGGGFLRRSVWISREERDEERAFREAAERELEETKAEEQISEEVGRKRREEEMRRASANTQRPPLQNLSGRAQRKGQQAANGGGFANIYLGTLNRSRAQAKTQVVAFKVLLAAERELDDKDLENFRGALRELAIWHMLSDHPRILPLFGFSLELSRYPAMISQWMDNGSLHDYLNAAGQSLSVFDRYRILRQICSGLACLHSRSIVHSDLTCSNVLIDWNGDAFLSDFGLSTVVPPGTQGSPPTNDPKNVLLAAKLLMDSEAFNNFDTSTLQYQSSQEQGNPRFMAPELYYFDDGSDGDHSKTIFSDIYALGGIILQSLTGKMPYHDLKRINADILFRVERGELPFRREDSSVLTDDQWKLICACWSRQPTERPALPVIMQYLQHPENSFTFEVSVLPHRTDITLDALVARSAGGMKETWTSEETTCVIKVFHCLPEREKKTVLEAIRIIGIIQHQNIHPYIATIELQGPRGGSIGVMMPSILNRTLSMYLETSYIPASKKLIILVAYLIVSIRDADSPTPFIY